MGIEPNSPNYQSNYALKLENNQELVHNRFVIPDQGSLRFNLHVPKTSINKDNPGTLTAFIKKETDSEYEPLEDIELNFADGNPKNYEADIHKLSRTSVIGTTGDYHPWFETFTIEIPDEYRNIGATLKFKLNNSPGEVYLDDVFFKSNDLRFGNPSEAEHFTELNKNNPNNYLLEKSQFSTAYDNSRKSPKSPLYSRREILVAKEFFNRNCPTYSYW